MSTTQNQLDAYKGWLTDRGLTLEDMLRSSPERKATAHGQSAIKVSFIVDKCESSGQALTETESALLVKMAHAMGLSPHDYKIAQLSDAGASDAYVALGPAALRDLKIAGDFSSLRGRWLNSPLILNSMIIATHHPRDLLANPQLKISAWQDLQIIMETLGLSKPAR